MHIWSYTQSYLQFNWLIAKMKKLVVNLYKTPKSLSLLVLALLCWMNSNFERYLFSSVSHIERFSSNCSLNLSCGMVWRAKKHWRNGHFPPKQPFLRWVWSYLNHIPAWYPTKSARSSLYFQMIFKCASKYWFLLKWRKRKNCRHCGRYVAQSHATVAGFILIIFLIFDFVISHYS